MSVEAGPLGARRIGLICAGSFGMGSVRTRMTDRDSSQLTADRAESSRQVREPTNYQGAVASALSRVDRAAARGDCRVALGWLRALEAIGDCPEHYRARRAAWRRGLRGELP
jgi:hypothetical protein